MKNEKMKRITIQITVLWALLLTLWISFSGPSILEEKDESGMHLNKIEFSGKEIWLSNDVLDDLWDVYSQTKRDYGLEMVFTNCYRSPKYNNELKGSPTSLHLGNGKGKHACDISKYDFKGENPLIIDLDGKVIFLKDIETEEGQKRFKEVIAKIYGKKYTDKIGEKFVKEVNTDLLEAVWGMHHIINDFMYEKGYTGGVTGEASPDGCPEMWHFQPWVKWEGAIRFSPRWNKDFITYKKNPLKPDETIRMTNKEKASWCKKNSKRCSKKVWYSIKKWWKKK